MLATELATFELDVTDRAAVAALPDQVIDAFGVIDGLVNNAGIIQPFERVLDLDDATIDRVLEVNLRSQISMVRAFLPHLLDRREAHMANVASMGAFLPVPGRSVYGASKAGVLLLTQGLYAELLEHARRGHGRDARWGGATSITTNSGVDVARRPPRPPSPAGSRRRTLRTPARRIVDGIEKDELYVHVGKDSVALHLLQRVAPKQATHLITRQMAQLLG